MFAEKWIKAERSHQDRKYYSISIGRNSVSFQINLLPDDISEAESFPGLFISMFLYFRAIHSAGIIKCCQIAFDNLRGTADFRDYSQNVAAVAEDDPGSGYRRMLSFPEDEIEKRNARIVKGLVNHDYGVVYHLYEEEFPLVLKMVVQNSGTFEHAKDLFQDSMVIIWEKVVRRELNLYCPLETYLFSICRILWLEHLRKRKRELSGTGNALSNVRPYTSFFQEEPPDNFEKVKEAVESLGEPCTKLLNLFYYKKMTWEEIALELGYASAASARNQKYKCLGRIKKMVDKK